MASDNPQTISEEANSSIAEASIYLVEVNIRCAEQCRNIGETFC